MPSNRTSDSAQFPSTIPEPKALEDMRNRLFALDEEVVLNAADFELYWPYCENIWSYHRKNVLQHGIVRTRYLCRLCRAGVPANKKDGVKHRNRAVREKMCSSWMTITTYLDGYRVFKRNQQPHAHTLAASDEASKNRMLRDYEVRVRFEQLQSQLSNAFFDLLRSNRVVHYRNHQRGQREMMRWIDDVQGAVEPLIQHDTSHTAPSSHADNPASTVEGDEEDDEIADSDPLQSTLEDSGPFQDMQDDYNQPVSDMGQE